MKDLGRYKYGCGAFILLIVFLAVIGGDENKKESNQEHSPVAANPKSLPLPIISRANKVESTFPELNEFDTLEDVQKKLGMGTRKGGTGDFELWEFKWQEKLVSCTFNKGYLTEHVVRLPLPPPPQLTGEEIHAMQAQELCRDFLGEIMGTGAFTRIERRAPVYNAYCTLGFQIVDYQMKREIAATLFQCFQLSNPQFSRLEFLDSISGQRVGGIDELWGFWWGE